MPCWCSNSGKKCEEMYARFGCMFVLNLHTKMQFKLIQCNTLECNGHLFWWPLVLLNGDALKHRVWGYLHYHHPSSQSMSHMGRFHFREPSSHFPFLNSLLPLSHISHLLSHISCAVCVAQLPTCPLPGIDCW